MAEPDDAAGVYPGVGSVFERDYGDEDCDSRARSDDAEPGGEKCFGGEPDAAVARAGVAGGRPDLQRPADQCRGAADADFGVADESVAAGARSAEPGAAAIADSAAGGEFAASLANRIAARGIAGGRSFGCDDGRAAGGCSGDTESAGCSAIVTAETSPTCN